MSDALAQASRTSIEGGSRSFGFASRLFDPATRESVHHLYAWCRHCDDVIDGQVLGHGQRVFGATPAQRLARLEAETRAALAGRPSRDPAFAALARIASQHRLPDFVPLDILRGFRMDVEGRSYRTVDDLFGYCYGVAGAVGIGTAILMGVSPDNRATLDRACDLGLAFQLTNIARDVMEDAAAGRLYLPAELFATAPTTALILDPRNRAAVVAATAAVLDLAERYYASAKIGLSDLPWRSAWAIATALGIYREIGRRVRRDPTPWAGRQTVPAWRKLIHVAAGAAAPLRIQAASARHLPRAGLWTRLQDRPRSEVEA